MYSDIADRHAGPWLLEWLYTIHGKTFTVEYTIAKNTKGFSSQDLPCTVFISGNVIMI